MGRHRRPRRVRFLVRVLIGVVLSTWLPTAAQAAFTDADAAPVAVGTYAVPAPASITGTFSCQNNRLSMSVTLTDFGAVHRATAYTVTLTAPNGQVTANSLPAGTRATTITRTSTTVGTYTLRVRASVGTWTGQNLERVLACP